MRDDEQVYPIETAAEVEDVSGLSAFQIHCLVLAANPEAIYAAAKDYLCTAERLEATADGIRRGATDLADSWHGSAADASQHQMQQYYASARSLATASRASATALNHAAAALAAAQIQVRFFSGGDVPSLDPTSLQSRCYQKALADLNTAYRDALTLAPTEIAVTLPAGGSAGRLLTEWQDMRDTAVDANEKSAKTYDEKSANGHNGHMVGGFLQARPQRLPSATPSAPPTSSPGLVGLPPDGGGQGRIVASSAVGPPTMDSRGGLF